MYQYERLNSDRLEMIRNEVVYFNGISVLDIGCAEGYFSREAKKLGASYVVGVCDNLHEEAKKLAQEENLDIFFIQGDFRKVEYPMPEFDCVFFLSMLHYFHTKEEKINALKIVAEKTKTYAFFEFEEGLNHPGHCSFNEFRDLVVNDYNEIKLLGYSDKNNRKIILCKK